MSLFMRELDSIARCAAQYRAEQLAPLGLKSCHASYLLEICSCPGISQEQLARRTYFSKSSVARQLAVLEEAGFVRSRKRAGAFPLNAGKTAPDSDTVFVTFRTDVTKAYTVKFYF